MEHVPGRGAEIRLEEQRRAEPEQRQPADAAREALEQPVARQGKQQTGHRVDHTEMIRRLLAGTANVCSSFAGRPSSIAGMQVLFDHVGYEPEARKSLLLEAAADTEWHSVEAVRLPSGASVLACTPQFVGAVDGWSCGPWWSLDVSDVRDPGRYAIAWRTGSLS